MKNIACRIFKEQIDVILCLPEEEQGEAIITILKHAFGIEYSTSKLSTQAQSIVNLLKKTIIVKEFSTNYGGRRPNAGKKAADHIADVSKMPNPAPEITAEQKAANREKAQRLIKQVTQTTTRQPDQVSITYNDVIVHGLLGKFLKQNFGEDTVTRARDWMIDHVAGQNWNADRIIKLMCKWTGKSPFVEINKWADFVIENKKQNKNQNNS